MRPLNFKFPLEFVTLFVFVLFCLYWVKGYIDIEYMFTTTMLLYLSVLLLDIRNKITRK
jgi:uncharacterized protein (DUF486 family)